SFGPDLPVGRTATAIAIAASAHHQRHISLNGSGFIAVLFDRVCDIGTGFPQAARNRAKSAHDSARYVAGSDVRFGSKADICSAPTHVRFTPNSDRESGHRQTVRSALPPKADMCAATRDVRFGPKADITPL